MRNFMNMFLPENILSESVSKAAPTWNFEYGQWAFVLISKEAFTSSCSLSLSDKQDNVSSTTGVAIFAFEI